MNKTIMKNLVSKLKNMVICIIAVCLFSACDSNTQSIVTNDSICELLGEMTANEIIPNYIGLEKKDFEIDSIGDFAFDPTLLCECMEEVMKRVEEKGFLAGISIVMANNDWSREVYEKHGVEFNSRDIDSLILKYLYQDTIEQIKSVDVFDSLIKCYSNGEKDVSMDSIELLNTYAAFQAWNCRYLDISDSTTLDNVIAGIEYVDSVSSILSNEGWHYWFALEFIDILDARSHFMRPPNINKVVEGFIRVTKDGGRVKHMRAKEELLEFFFDTLSIEPYPKPETLVP